MDHVKAHRKWVCAKAGEANDFFWLESVVIIFKSI
jgi:hypothetical protein